MSNTMREILAGVEGVCIGIILCRLLVGPEVAFLSLPASIVLMAIQVRRGVMFWRGKGWSLA